MDTEECIVPILPAVRSQSIGVEIPHKETVSVGDQITKLSKDSTAYAENKTMPSQDGDHHGICCRKLQISHTKELR